MNAILLEGQSSQNVKLLIALAHKLGVKTHKISTQQWEDHLLATKIEAGMETGTVSKDEILKALSKK